MKLKIVASVLALAVFASPVLAQDQGAAQPAQEQAAPQLPEQVVTLLSEKRQLPELSLEELKARITLARQFAKDESLPEDVRQQLGEIAKATKAEIEARAQAQEQPDQQQAQQDAQPPAAQPEKKAEAPAPPPEAKPQVPEAVMALFADQRAANELNNDELQVRSKVARRFAKDENLPEDVRQQLKQIGDAAHAELQARADAEKQKAAEKKAAKDAADKAAAEQAAAEKAAQEKAAAEQAATEKAAQEQAAADKAAKKKAAEEQAAADKAAKEAADKAAADQAAAEAAAQQKAAAEQASKDQAAAAKAAQDKAAAEAAAKATADKAVQEQAAQPKPPAAPQPEAKPLEKPAAAVPAAAPPVQAPQPENVQKLDANAGDPAAEKQAQAYIGDATDVSKLDDTKLRDRLDGIRELLAANELSRDTERAVRNKLKQEREILRQRLAQAEAAKQADEQKKAQAAAAAQPAPAVPAQPQANASAQKPVAPPVAPSAAVLPLPPVAINVPPPPPPPAAPLPPPRKVDPQFSINVQIGFITPVTPTYMVLRDRRPPDRLQVSELQRRIQAYEEAQADAQYSADYQDYWRRAVAYDRAVLRERLKQERHRREAELAMAGAAENDVEIDPYAQTPRRKPRAVFAAEVDDADMLDVLTAPPPHQVQQRYRLKDIANEAPVRNSVSRIEIDTLRFGYNEGFIREEQLNALDPVARIIERIVKKYPNEVFLIEGHTDAPGSDAYNLKLSKLRAESVKRALSAYYVIPAKNLRTAGLGERFLKIPTADAEPENRRVSVARITPLLSQGQ